MEINVEKELVVKAILDSLTPEKRDELLKGAIASCFEGVGERDTIGRKTKSRLQVIYESAAHEVAVEAIREQMQTPEVREQFNRLARDVILKAIDEKDGNYPTLVERLAGHFIASLNKGERY
jgi:hypothetical protein